MQLEGSENVQHCSTVPHQSGANVFDSFNNQSIHLFKIKNSMEEIWIGSQLQEIRMDFPHL